MTPIFTAWAFSTTPVHDHSDSLASEDVAGYSRKAPPSIRNWSAVTVLDWQNRRSSDGIKTLQVIGCCSRGTVNIVNHGKSNFRTAESWQSDDAVFRESPLVIAHVYSSVILGYGWWEDQQIPPNLVCFIPLLCLSLAEFQMVSRCSTQERGQYLTYPLIITYPPSCISCSLLAGACDDLHPSVNIG